MGSACAVPWDQGSLVGGGTSQSLVTQFLMPVLRYLEVINNFNWTGISFRKYY